MRKDAILVEESRLVGVECLNDYKVIKERHRIFPAIFEERNHRNILDIAAGVGFVARDRTEYADIPRPVPGGNTQYIVASLLDKLPNRHTLARSP